MKKLLLISLLVVGLISGCGGGSQVSSQVITITLTGGMVTLQAGGTLQITATVANDAANKGVTWSVACTTAPCGAVAPTTTPSGTPTTYTAPPNPPASNLTVTITATSVADSSKTATTTITIPAITVSVAPPTTTVLAGNTQSFTATVQNTGNVGVTWKLTQGGNPCAPGCGMLSSTATNPVTYTAPGRPASNLTVAITATSAADTTKSGSATITVPAIAVAVSPGSANVPVGGTQNFTATVSNDAGNLGVTWTLAQAGAPCSPGCGTIAPAATSSGAPATYTAPATLLANPMVTITATSVSDTSKSNSATATVVGITVSVAPPTASVAVTAMQQFIATVANDVTSSGVTWTLTQAGTPCSPTCGTIAPTTTASGTPTTYTAPATVPTPATVTVTATSVADPTTSGSASITITSVALSCTPANNGELIGQYAFLFTGFDAGGAMAMAGSFIADGTGGLNVGLRDVNRTTGVTTSQAFTGTYCVGADNRGTFTITATGGANETYALALGSLTAGISANARFIEFDTTGTRGSGVIELQNPAAFSNAAISGGYALGLSGATSTGTRFGLAGRFNADGAGGINSGVVDTDSGGTLSNSASGGTFTVSSNSPFTGTYSVAGTGRGMVTVTAGPNTLHFSIYVVSAAELFQISTDPQSANGVSSGQVLQQQSAPFSQSSLNGISVISLNGLTLTGPEVNVGLVTSDGAGNFTFSTDENKGGTIKSPNSFTGTYSVAPNGRVTTTTVNGPPPPVFYLVGPNQGFVVGTDNFVTTGFFEPQSTGPFNNASVSGNFFFGTTTPVNTDVSDESGVVTLDGSGSVTGTSDSSQTSGLFPNQAFSDTYNVASNGRATVPAAGTASNVFYIVSPSKAILISVKTTNANPSIEVIEK